MLAATIVAMCLARGEANRGFALGVRAAARGGDPGDDAGWAVLQETALRAHDAGARGGGDDDAAATARGLLERLVDGRAELAFRRRAAAARDAAAAELAAAATGADAFALRATAARRFAAAVAAAPRPGGGWSAAAEREALAAAADALAAPRRAAADAQLAAAEAQGRVLALYQALQSEVQQLQQRSYATPPPLNAGFAYRVRDTDVNVSGGFSQGRGQLQVSAVDDETIMEGDPALVTAPSHGHVGVSVVL